jgi:hypothetical protein
VRRDEPLTSVEAFALALVEASSRLNGDARSESAREPATPDAPHDDAAAGPA